MSMGLALYFLERNGKKKPKRLLIVEFLGGNVAALRVLIGHRTQV